MILEPPSFATLKAKEKVSRMRLAQFFSFTVFVKTDEAALRPDESELAKLSASVHQTEPPRKKRGPKGPNPLSVKKKSTVSQLTEPKPKSQPTSKRKREDEEPARTGQAPDSGHKRKRRRKTKTESSPNHHAS